MNNRRLLKWLHPFLYIIILVLACNRPMLQPPMPDRGTQSGTILPLTPARSALTATTAFTSQSSSTQHLSPENTLKNLPVNATETVSTPSGKYPTQFPYSTPHGCPVEPASPPETIKLRVVYANQEGLWVKDDSNSIIRLSQNKNIVQVSLSDDGHIIAYTRQLDEYHAELWEINTDGSSERRLVSPDQFMKLDGSQDALGVLPSLLRWEPGSHHIIFYTYPIFHAIWVFEPSTIWLIDADTGEVSKAPYHGGYVSFAPDGKQVAIYNSSGISLVSLDGTHLRENILPPYHGIAEGESYYDPKPFWSPDSSSFLVAMPDQDDMYTKDASVTIWRIPVHGTPIKMGQWKAFGPSISVSPDQNYLTYWPSPQGIANMREFHIANISSQNDTSPYDSLYLRGDLIDLLAWSPDSRHFIFQMGDPGEQGMSFYLGDICQQPNKIGGFVPGGVLPWNIGSNIADWVATNRYLLVTGLPDRTDRWYLYLGSINQVHAEKIGEITAYDWAILP